MIAENLLSIKNTLPENIKLIAVSKTKPEEDILEAYATGHKIFGENKALELQRKANNLPKDIEWHFIGHLQRNKVKYIAPFVSLIHAVDSLRLLQEINKEAIKNNRVIDCLLQFHIATEAEKFGLSLDSAKEILNSNEYQELKNINIVGVMGMATFCQDNNQIKKEFSELRSIFLTLKSDFLEGNDSFCEISMGMSDDYKIAVEEGSTMLRIGSSIFGKREFSI